MQSSGGSIPSKSLAGGTYENQPLGALRLDRLADWATMTQRPFAQADWEI